MTVRHLRIAVASIWGTAVLVTAAGLILPRFIFWALERFAERQEGLQ